MTSTRPSLVALATMALIMAPWCQSADASEKRRQSLTRWTRHYEHLMGVGSHEIFFEDVSPYCAMARFEIVLGSIGPRRVSAIIFSDEKCHGWSDRRLAAHEVCHWRMQHPYMELSAAEQEREANACADEYMRRESSDHAPWWTLILLLP